MRDAVSFAFPASLIALQNPPEDIEAPGRPRRDMP